MHFSSKVLFKFSVAAIAIASAVGCGSGAAKPFSSTTTTVNNAGSGSNSSTPGSSAANPGAGTSASNPGTSAPVAAPAPAPTAAPAPSSTPAGGTVLASLQSQPGWQMCGGCGNVGGTGQGPDYRLTQGIANPSLSGSATDFYVNGGPAYTGGYYFIEQRTFTNPVSFLQYEFDLYVPAQYADAPQALEFECQQTTNGDTYNFAWQADYASNTWRVFNYTTKEWEGTGVPLQRFSPNTWHHISAIFHAAGTQAIHDSLTVDGQTKNVNISHPATHTGTALEFSAGFQVDLNAASTPYHVYVDNLKAIVKE